jgi:hypothetical protein
MAMGLQELYRAEKRAVMTDWVEDEAGRLRLTLALEIDGAVVEALFLRARVFRGRVDRDVMFQLEYRPPFGPDEQLCRIEWRPTTAHRNHGKGPEAYRFKDIAGSHYHSFKENWLEDQGRMRGGNLPIAVPLEPDPSDFGQLVALVSKEFRIMNLGDLPMPPWDMLL